MGSRLTAPDIAWVMLFFVAVPAAFALIGYLVGRPWWQIAMLCVGWIVFLVVSINRRP